MSSPRRRTFWIGAVLFASVLWTGLVVAAKWAGRRLNENPPRQMIDDSLGSSGLKTLWPTPAFSFTNQDAKTVTNADLIGHVCVADFIYTQCTTACPVLSAKMVMLQKQVPDPAVRFVSFSVDPAHDTPAALKDYRTLWHGDPMRWTLLSTDPAGLARLVDAMHVVAIKQDDQLNPIVHSDLFFLIDAQGIVRGLYSSVDPSQMDQLVIDANALAGNGGATSPMMVSDGGSSAVDRGRTVASAMGCMACHSQPRIAPPLAGIYHTAAQLEGNKIAWVDEAYLRESIVSPAAKVVRGYPPTMPSYGKLLSDGQMSDLLAWLEAGADARPDSKPAADPVELLVDPTCLMKVTVTPETPRAVWQGKSYYFCSESCREMFRQLHHLP